MELNPLTIYEILGLVLTCTTAIITYLRSSTEARDRNAAVASLIGVVLTVTLGLRFDALAKLTTTLRAAEVIRSDPRRKGLLEKVGRAGPSAAPSHELMSMSLHGRLRALQEQFNAMSEGRFIVNEAEMPVFNLKMIANAKETIRATNFIGISRWWDEPWGERYELANEDAVKNGVKVQRTFIFSRNEDVNIARAIMMRQVKAGVKVRYGLTAELPAFTGDVIVIDERLAGEHRIIPGRGLSVAQFSVNEEDVKRIAAQLNATEANAREWKQ